MRGCIVALVCSAFLPLAAADVQIDRDFPGGNILVEKIDGDTVHIRQDLRDTEGDWFYWHFRARGAAGRTLKFQFTGSDVLGALGPAVSDDAGATWRWLGSAAVKGKAFSYTFPAGAGDTRFCFALPYLETNLNTFLEKHKDRAELKREVLCRSQKNREIEKLRAGRLDGQAAVRLVFTARHHACEMLASYVLEGILEETLADSDAGKWLRQNAEIVAIPFMDKDGVEDGDQGKNRRPHDHNRDYADGLYPSVRAVRELAPLWSDGKLRAAFDLHCPYNKGGRNETIFLVLGPQPAINARLERLSKILETSTTGELKFFPKNNIPHGVEWNTMPADKNRIMARWFGAFEGVRLAATLEFPYANSSGTAVTPENARHFGRDFMRAIVAYLREE